MIDTKELRRLAQAATPGPDGVSLSWITLLQDFQQGANPAVINELLDRLEDAESDGLEQARLNGMGASREAALMAKLEAMEKDIAMKERIIDSLGVTLTAVVNERDELRANIEAMEQQEPVAFALYSGWARKAVYLSEIEACEQRDRRQLTADLGGSLEAYRVVPLYLAPGAQPAPSIPEGWKLVPIEVIDLYSFMCAAFVPMTPQQEQIALQLDLAKRAMLAAAPEAK